MFVKGLTIGLLCISLSGCASFIANQITTERASNNVEGNLSGFAVERPICDGDSVCVKTVHLDDEAAEHVDLSFNFKINESHKIWRYKSDRDNVKTVKPLTNQLIFLFAGYGQPTQILFMHQTWLHHITGAKVIVVPSAENSNKFQFGLDYVSPIVAEIERLKPTQVHLVGFSMGALAASAVGQKIDNAKLYLVAPMTDFEYSTNAIYNALYKNKFYTKFISQDTLDNAIQIVYEKAGMRPKDTNLLLRLDETKLPTFIYTSNKDKVVDPTPLNALSNSNIDLSNYEDLGHLEMVALFRNDLLIDFVSDLLGRQVLISEITTLGAWCNFDDTDCLNQIPN